MTKFLGISGLTELIANIKTELEKKLSVNTAVTYTDAQKEQGCKNLQTICVPKSAGAHNGVYRGKKLATIPAASGDLYTIAQLSSMVTAGTFDDIFIGDYIEATVTINGSSTTKKWYFAGFDTFWNNGDSATTTHHAIMVPESALYNSNMNATNVTTGGYVGSRFFTEELALINTGLQNAFGSSHVLSHKELLSTAMTGTTASMAGAGFSGASTGWAWQTVLSNLMNEAMVYGVTPCSSSFYDIGDRHEQLPLFRLAPDKICTRGYWWLSAMTSSTHFAFVYHSGLATCDVASTSYGVRPYFLFH